MYDKAMTKYAAKLEHGAGVVPETVDEGSYQALVDGGLILTVGWGLKSVMVKKNNFTEDQKAYLTELFLGGERSGQKADPSSKSKAIRRSTKMVHVSLTGTTSSHLCGSLGFFLA